MGFSKYILLSFFQFYILRFNFFLNIYFNILKITNFIKNIKKNSIKIFFNYKKKNDEDQSYTNNEYVIINSNISYVNYDHFFITCELLNYFKKLKVKPFLFKSKQFRSQLNKIGYESSNPLNFYSKISIKNIKEISNQLINKTISTILKYEYHGVSCGKYAISTSMRMLRVSEIDLNNKNQKLCLLYNLRKSIMYADAAINFVNSNKIKFALFNDRGYSGEGELYDICIKNNITCVQYIATYKNNSFLFKKFNENNKFEHPSAVSEKIWNIFSNKTLSSTQEKYLFKEIEKGYLENTWYPSAGTMVGKNIKNYKEINNELGIKNSKKIAVIFPHIFWDGTFFYGEDLFLSYEQWFEQTIKYAEKNKNINWIIKAHPSNQTKNAQDNIKEKKIEPELEKILNIFGKLPDNFYYLPSKSKINTYFLLNLLDYCITVRGTVGLEAAMRGKYVITAGTGRYENKGFTHNYMDISSYRKTIENLDIFESSLNDIKSQANKFAYISLICKNFIPDNFNFYYKQNIKSEMFIDENFFSNTFEIKNDDNFIKWLSNSEEDYFKDPCDHWHIL